MYIEEEFDADSEEDVDASRRKECLDSERAFNAVCRRIAFANMVGRVVEVGTVKVVVGVGVRVVESCGGSGRNAFGLFFYRRD